MSTHENAPATKPGLSLAALFYGLFLLVALLVLVSGFGIGLPELTLWVLLVVGWVSFWMLRRRR